VDHCHATEPARDASKAARRQLTIAVGLCSVFVVGEALGGWLSGSLAIMGDAAHMFSDLASFGLSLFVLWLSDKPASKKLTFGYYRAETLGALATLVIIWYVTGVLVYMAVARLATGDFEIHGTAMLATSAAAVVFNVFLGLTLHGGLAACRSRGGGHGAGGERSNGVGHGHSHGASHGHSHGPGEHGGGQQINIRAALIHVLGDLLQSIGVLVSSIVIHFQPEAKAADPACTLVFAAIVVVTTVPVLRDVVSTLLEGRPEGLDYDQVLEDLLGVQEVHQVHSLHLWALAVDVPCLSAHLTTAPGSDHDAIRARAAAMLRSKHQIFRSTLQVETHQAQVMAGCARCHHPPR